MKKKLSILIYSLSGGGAERVVSILLKSFKDIFDVHLVMMNSTITYEIPQDIKVFYIEGSKPEEHGIFKFLKLPFLALRYKKFCQAHSIDISLSFLSRCAYISIISKFFRNKAKIFISERATPSLQYGYRNVLSKVNVLLISLLYTHSDQIITNSYGNRSDLIKNFGLKKHKLITIYNPFDIQHIESQANIDIKMPDADFIFVTVGRLDIGKNHELIIKALDNIQNRTVKLFIIGDGPLKKQLKQLTLILNLNKQIEFIGFDVNPYCWMRNSDCLIFGSNHEGFPNVLLEALACNLPVISTDCISGPREILAPDSDYTKHITDDIEYAEFGILTPVGNVDCMAKAMQKMIIDSNLRTAYKEKAFKRAQDFSKEIIVPKYIDLIKD